MITRNEFIDRVEREKGHQHIREYMSDKVLNAWLDLYSWIDDPEAPCQACEIGKKTKWFSRKKCEENKESGGACYRETLRDSFAPFVRNAIKDICPDPFDKTQLHPNDQLHHDGFSYIPNDLASFIDHELGGVFTYLSFNRFDEIKKERHVESEKLIKARDKTMD